MRTKLWFGIPLITKAAGKFVLRALLPTAMRKFPSMEKSARPHKMEKSWARFTTTTVIDLQTGEVKHRLLMKPSWVAPAISASAAAENPCSSDTG